MSERAITGDIDTAKLVAQARDRETMPTRTRLVALADALEAAEAENATLRDALQEAELDTQGALARLEVAEAENRRLREALAQIASDIHPARPVDARIVWKTARWQRDARHKP